MARVSVQLKKNGFTLVEILMAAAILATALCGILLVYNSCSALIITSKDSSVAMAAAAAKLEEIRSYNPFSNITAAYNLKTYNITGLPNAKGVIYVDSITDPSVLTINTSVCWRQGNRVIGEDQNLNGVLNTGEDTNGNGYIDSPVGLSARMTNR